MKPIIIAPDGKLSLTRETLNEIVNKAYQGGYEDGKREECSHYKHLDVHTWEWDKKLTCAKLLPDSKIECIIRTDE